ncbi:MAG: response regulator transcription factor [Anaerolineae bacterium]
MAHILVAEDERDIRELINFTLMFAGHTVTLAANGAEAVEKATQETTKPDLIMMDVRMPRMTGYEACRQLKLIDDFKETPVVFLSAKGQDEEIQTGISVGASAYILKPFSPDELIRRVADLLSQKEAAKTPVQAPAQASAETPVQTPAEATTPEPAKDSANDPAPKVDS